MRENNHETFQRYNLMDLDRPFLHLDHEPRSLLLLRQIEQSMRSGPPAKIIYVSTEVAPTSVFERAFKLLRDNRCDDFEPEPVGWGGMDDSPDPTQEDGPPPPSSGKHKFPQPPRGKLPPGWVNKSPRRRH